MSSCSSHVSEPRPSFYRQLPDSHARDQILNFSTLCFACLSKTKAMRITTQLLRRRSAVPLEEAEHVDLSGKGIVAIERLSPCKRLCSLVLSHNSVDAIRSVDCCHNLWYLDLSGNKVKGVGGLSRFPVFGVLNLACNDLGWEELRRLSHMTLLSLSLLGNTKLDSDPHYREHVVDILPNLWSLDGRLITAEERSEVRKFFADSEATEKPVRRKAVTGVFVPSNLKNLLVTGVFGEKTTHLMSRFPINYIHNTEMDRKRLRYLAHTLQEQMQLQVKYSTQQWEAPQLVSLIEHRDSEVEQCNMLLLLLLASAVFNLPHDVMKATLETAKLSKIGEVSCVDLLSLPGHMIVGAASLLLSAAAVDRVDRREGGLYLQLYHSLCLALDTLTRSQADLEGDGNRSNWRKLTETQEAREAQLHCLLASEVVHLMCLVPRFFESMETSDGLMEMLVVATRNPHIADVIGSIAWKVQARGGDVWEVYHDIASHLLQATSANVLGRKRKPHPSLSGPSPFHQVHRTTSQLIQSTRSRHSLSNVTRALSAGASSARRGDGRPAGSSSSSRGGCGRHSPSSMRQPELGDLVLVAPDRLARIVALPESHVAVLQMNPKTSASTSPTRDGYFYTDAGGLLWDHRRGVWTKEDLAADLSTSRLSPSPPSLSTLHHPHTSTLSLESYSRGTTPEPHARPLSQMSFFSDDLQTIPSQDEFTEEEEEEEEGECSRSVLASPLPGQRQHAATTPIRVDICDRARLTRSPSLRLPSSEASDAARSELQRHIVKQYISSQSPSTPPHPPAITSSHPPPSPPLTVPTPHLTPPRTWLSSKSVSSVTASRPHNCQQTATTAATNTQQSAKPEAHSINTVVLSPSNPRIPGYSSLLPSSAPPKSHHKAVLYNTWTVATANSSTRHTHLSTGRLAATREPTPVTVARKGNGLRSMGRSAGRLAPGHMTSHDHRSSSSPSGKYQFQPRKQQQQQQRSKAPSTRRLGDVRSLYVGGVAID